MAVEQDCRRCGEANQEGQRYCGGCGASLERVCPTCDAVNPAGFRFCGSCGASLDDAATPAAPDPVREERRWATVVFADLSGFTRMSEQTDPEDVRALVDRCVARMADIIEEHGGWFDSVLGDGVLAVFGADTAHGDDAERAVRTALELRRCSGEHAEDFGNLELSIGVNTGELMFAAVGPGERRELTVMGDTVNTAARLQAAAPPGAIFVGEPTWRATRATVRYEPVEPVSAKGKQDLLQAWSAVEASSLAIGRPLSTVPLVGRSVELSALTDAWGRTLDERRPQLVTVLGPAGIGKTKLAMELTGAVVADGGRVAHGRSLPYGESTGYGAFSSAVRHMLGIRDTDGADEAAAVLRGRVRELLGAEAGNDVTTDMVTLVGLTDGGGTDKESLLFSARRFVEALAREAPTTFVFEDIHWADPSLLELIESLATRCRDAPVLFLTLARPELFDRAPRWGGGVPAYTALSLEPLGADEALQLAALHLGGDEFAGMAARVVDIGDGNPLFIEELTTAVVEGVADVDQELPSNVRAIIAARLDALPARERAVVLDAAVVGKVFWRGALEDLGHEDLERSLDALDRRDLVRREPSSRFEGDQEFTFRHMLIREVAYATVSKAVRRERHAEVARFLERVAAGRSIEVASTLAHHWREAGDHARAVDYLVAAAERAGSAWAAEEATQLYTEAMSLLPAEAGERRRELQLARGLVLGNSAFYAEAAADLDAVLPHLEGSELAEALLVRGSAAIWLMDAQRATRCAEEALALSVQGRSGEDLTGPALSLVAISRSVDGRLDTALELQQQALDAWEPGARPRQLANDLGMMALASYWVGAHDQAIEHARRSYEMAMEQHAVGAALQGGSHLAMALTGAGLHEEALEVFEKVLAQGRELERSPRLTSRTLNMMATALREVGDLEEAKLRNLEGIERARQADFGAASTQGGIDLVYAGIIDGELGRAQKQVAALRESVEALSGWHQWLGRIRLALAEAEIDLGSDDLSAAAGTATEAVRQAVAVGRPKYEALARATLGSALSGLGRHDEALAELRRSVAVATSLGHPATQWRTAAALADGLASDGGEDEAARVADQALSLIEAFADRLGTLRREGFLTSHPVVDVRQRMAAISGRGAVG